MCGAIGVAVGVVVLLGGVAGAFAGARLGLAGLKLYLEALRAPRLRKDD
jgi:hypothetical protein